MATQFGENLLSTNAANWVLTNATLNSGSLTIKAGGVAYTEVTALNGMNFIPEALCVQVKATQYSNKYKPTAFIHVQITFIDDNTFDALVPIVNNADGNKAILHPTVSKYDVGVSAFKRIRHTVKSSEDIVLTTYTLQKSINDVVLEDRDYYGVQLSQKDGLTIKRMTNNELQSEAIFNSDILSMRAKIDGQMKDCIYFNTEKQRYCLSGDVLIEGSIQAEATITEAMYAEQGDISQLTVDRLETSDKIKRYLSKDTSDMAFIRIEGVELRFIIATVSVNESGVAETKPLVNRYGSTLYWSKDISNANIVDGYPYIDNVRVYATEKNTGFPITVYSYTESIIRQIVFIYDPLKDAYYCTETFGQGAGTNAAGEIVNQGRLQKTTTEFFMKYKTEQGKEIGIQMNNSGFTDIVGMRKPTGISFSDWDKGKFYERVDGDDTRYEYNVTFDSQGRPTKITDSNGHETALYW